MDNVNNFEYRGWHVHLEIISGGSAFSGHADVTLNGVQKCRLVLSTTTEDLVSAKWALDSKARDYIDNYVDHLQSGLTSLGRVGDDSKLNGDLSEV